MLTQEQKNEAVLLRLSGWTYKDIGAKYGITKQATHYIVNKLTLGSIAKRVFRDYVDIWRGYMALNKDMDEDDMNRALHEVSTNYKIRKDVVVKLISDVCNEELRPARLPKHHYPQA